MLTESKMKKIAPTSSYSTAPICYLLNFYFSLLPKFMNHKYRSIFCSYLRNFQDFGYRTTTYSSPVATCQRYSIKNTEFVMVFLGSFPQLFSDDWWQFFQSVSKRQKRESIFSLLRKQLKGPLKGYFVFLFFLQVFAIKKW